MSRRHSSTFNLTGTKRRATPSPTRSPARPTTARVPLRPPRPIAPPPVLRIEDPGDGIGQIDVPDQPDLPRREEVYGQEIDKYNHLVGGITTIDTCYIALPDCDGEGRVYRGRMLRFVSCRIQKSGDNSIGVCSCDMSRKMRVESVESSVMLRNYEAYQNEECIHLVVARSLPLFADFLTETDHAIVTSDSVQFSTEPCLFLVRDKRLSSGVVKITRMTITCLTCHSQRCEHCNSLSSEYQEEIKEIREEIEEEEESFPPRVSVQPVAECVHGHPLDSRRAVLGIADRDGVVRQESVHLQHSDCCKYLIHPLPLVPLSTAFSLERKLILHYEASFTQAGVSLNGYWNTMREYRVRCEEDPGTLLSLSSLKRGWTNYLSTLDIPADRFICPECGAYPETLVFDATTIGTRGDLGSYVGRRDPNRVLNSHTPGWFGTREMRKQMREFSKGGNAVTIWIPPEFISLLKHACNEDGSFNKRFGAFFSMMFADSPIPDILKVGSDGRARQLVGHIVDRSIDFSDKETAEDMLRYLPVLYKSLSDIGFDYIPDSIPKILHSALTLNDSVLRAPIRRDSLYGPITDSLLEFFPNWPLKRGRSMYQKDSRIEHMDCSQKIGNGHNKLSPGILIVTCHHRYTYGFTILTSCESPRHIFEILTTRMDGGEMPRNIIYDNGCHLSAYCLAREPGRFRNTRFFIDRFHERNHKSCCSTMRMSSYSSDEKLSKINTQCVEQTNATLRHVANIIPFLSVEKYRKCLMLYLSRNQRKSTIK